MYLEKVSLVFANDSLATGKCSGVLGSDFRDDLRVLERRVLRRVDQHLELRQDVLGYLESLLEDLVEDGDDDLPVAEDRVLRELQLSGEHPFGCQRPIPLLYPVSFPVLRGQSESMTFSDA